MSNDKKQRPDWVPENAGIGFTTSVLPAKESGHDGLPDANKQLREQHASPKTSLSVDEYAAGILSGNRTILARAITLVESNAAAHQVIAQELLRKLASKESHSLRVGITGVPGAGKSTFIEAFGLFLTQQQHRRVAVLAIDPTSTVTKGSILGDKTRMELLARDDNCFIRPSPSGGTLGGVTRKTRETILLCEAAGYDTILIETVGVGQNEVTVRSMVDFFLLILISGGGDELQGIKKGIMELADAVLINKADGDNVQRAELARAEYSHALHYLSAATPGWKSNAFTCSSLNGQGIAEIYQVMRSFERRMRESRVFYERRQHQLLEWVNSMIIEHLEQKFFQYPAVKEALPSIQSAVLQNELTATQAVAKLLGLYNN